MTSHLLVRTWYFLPVLFSRYESIYGNMLSAGISSSKRKDLPVHTDAVCSKMYIN